MNWNGNRYKEKYTFKRVAWENWQEHEEYKYITGGEIELAEDSELKVTGSFDFDGLELPNARDLLRVYYSFEDSAGEEAYEPIATLFLSMAEVSYTDTDKGAEAKGSADGLSVLSVLGNRVAGVPMTFKRNANCIYETEQLIRSCGLLTETEISSFCLTADHTFDADATYLEIVNWLLDTAGYLDAYPDALGAVVLRSQASAQNSTESVYFANDAKSIMYPEVEVTNEWQETPNVVRLLYNTDSAYLTAEARNLSGSRASLDASGAREVTYFDEVSELGSGNRLEYLRQLAETTLREQSCDIEYVTFEHAYIPLQLHDKVQIDYGEFRWQGFADNINIELTPGTKTQTKIRKELQADIEVLSDAQAVRGE